MTICHIALGGNVGDVIATMDRGLDLLDESDGVSVTMASPVYQTAPVGPCTGDAFLNAAATLECDLDPLALLRLLKSVEESVGRESGSRWGPRPLDLDLLLMGDNVVREPPLKVPHPHMWYRRFVLDPLVDIVADGMHPLLHSSIMELQTRLLQRPLPISIRGQDANAVWGLARLLSKCFPAIEVVAQKDSKPPHQAAAIDLDLDEAHHTDSFSGTHTVRLCDLPGTLEKAAESVLVAALDEPVRQSRPLRRMP